MLLPLIARHAHGQAHLVHRYAAWANALRRDGSIEERLARIPAEQREEARLDLVRQELHRRAGARLEDYALPQVPADLVEDEFVARHRHGEVPSLEEYERRFPGAAARLSGRIVAGRYAKLRRLGWGAMGEVWEAFDRRAGRTVALKLPVGALARFREEMRLLSQLAHPAIVPVFDLDDGESPFYVMRLVSGPTLAEQIRREPRRALLERFAVVCDAVAHAHGRGVLHRDLKPGNVIAGDETVLIDWGMAARAGAASGGEVAGTPEYMAPEQAAGAADERSDVYGLGAILYEILAGRPPHPVVRPRGVPRALAAICMKALAPEPERRFASASGLGASVRAHLAAPWPARIWHALTAIVS